jgi:hypothetical protein
VEPTIDDSTLRCGLITFFANVKLGWKLLTATKGLAYNTVVLITTLKNFMGQVLGVIFIHFFFATDERAK